MSRVKFHGQGPSQMKLNLTRGQDRGQIQMEVKREVRCLMFDKRQNELK